MHFTAEYTFINMMDLFFNEHVNETLKGTNARCSEIRKSIILLKMH